MSKLTDQQKIEIVEKYKTGKYNCSNLSKEYNLYPNSIRLLLIKRNIPIIKISEIQRKYTLNQNYFDKIDTEDKAYFLGLLYSDGYNCEKQGEIAISLQEQDKLILEKFNTVINSNRPLTFKDYKSKRSTWKNQFKLSINSKHMSQQLAKLGCFQAKSLTLKFPTEEQVPSNLIRHFIRGYFDGDGSIMYNKKRKSYYCIIVSTLDFCNTLYNILKDFKINSGISRPRTSITRNNSTRRQTISGNNQCVEFLHYLYKDSTIYLDRKYSRYINCIKKELFLL